MLITKFIEIDLGHRIPNHNSKCRNLHGHRYRILVGVDDKVINKSGDSSEGMVIDFSDLKKIMMQEIDNNFDHGFMLYKDDAFVDVFVNLKDFGQKIIITDFIPTAENFAKHLFCIMKNKLLEKKIRLDFVEVYETPSSTAKYTRSDHENS